VDAMPAGFVVANNNAELDSGFGPKALPGVGSVMPLSEKLTAGVGLYVAAGGGVEFTEQNLLGGGVSSLYQQVRLAPAVSYRLLPNLSVGAALNTMWASFEYALAAGIGMEPRETASSLGIGATVGVHYRPVDFLALGVAYETKGNFQDFEYNIPAHQKFNPTTGSFDAHPGGTEKLQLDSPSVVTFGAGVTPLAGLLLTGDVQFIRWSEVAGAGMPALATDPSVTGATPFDMDWSDQWVFKVGAQYEAAPWLTLRAGYNYGKSPLQAGRALENITFPAIAEQHYTAGVGVRWGQATIDVSGYYASAPALRGSLPELGIASYEIKMSQLAVNTGMSYRF
jgi:long-chain fatty acid transport protein